MYVSPQLGQVYSCRDFLVIKNMKNPTIASWASPITTPMIINWRKNSNPEKSNISGYVGISKSE